MALRMLAGPFDIVNIDGGAAPTGIGSWMWYPGVGLIAVFNSWSRGLLALDGKFCSVSVERSMLHWYADMQRPMVFGNKTDGCYEYTLEPKAFVWNPVQMTPVASYSPPYQLARVGNRYFTYNNGVYLFDIATGHQTFLYADVAGADSTYVGPGRHLHELFYGAVGTSGDVRCWFYDTLTGVMEGPWHLGMAARGVAYAPEFGILISLHSDPYEMRIWSLEVMPTSISTPTPVQTVRKGRVVDYRVRVLGAQSDPCKDEVVEWTVTGAGTLLSPTSVTDQDGYAEVKVLYRLDAGAESTVQASLKC